MFFASQFPPFPTDIPYIIVQIILQLSWSLYCLLYLSKKIYLDQSFQLADKFLLLLFQPFFEGRKFGVNILWKLEDYSGTLCNRAECTLGNRSECTLGNRAECTLSNRSECTLGNRAECTLCNRSECTLSNRAECTLDNRAECALGNRAECTLGNMRKRFS